MGNKKQQQQQQKLFTREWKKWVQFSYAYTQIHFTSIFDWLQLIFQIVWHNISWFLKSGNSLLVLFLLFLSFLSMDNCLFFIRFDSSYETNERKAKKKMIDLWTMWKCLWHSLHMNFSIKFKLSSQFFLNISSQLWFLFISCLQFMHFFLSSLTFECC